MQYARTRYASAFICLIMMISASVVRSAVQDIYPAPSRASADLAAALASAAATHKRVIVDFGGNWCTDCHVLDSYFHDSTNKPILDANYILVHINIGHMDANVNIADRYQIPLKRGVPAVAVLDARGILLYSQKTGEFEAMRQMQSGAVTDFLVHWKDPASVASGSLGN
jgi:thiol:disulfide interchange protein